MLLPMPHYHIPDYFTSLVSRNWYVTPPQSTPLQWNSGLTTWLKSIIRLATNKWECLTSYSWWSKLKILFSTGVSEGGYWHSSCSSRPAPSRWCVFALSLLSFYGLQCSFYGMHRSKGFLVFVQSRNCKPRVEHFMFKECVKIPGEVQL